MTFQLKVAFVVSWMNSHTNVWARMEDDAVIALANKLLEGKDR